ncbi:hypothetical protein [Variovorax sp. YR752]|uniref:hypothetical protein n=1 Tax=Variovorax sp. YR752 TaxID=1884383 RepID=UPI003137FF1F
MGPDLILSAVLATFGKSAAGTLVRFARRFAGEKIGLAVESETSPTSQAARFARELAEAGKLSEALFDALESTSPEYKDIIDRARQAWRREQGDETVRNAEAVAASAAVRGPGATATGAGVDDWLVGLDAVLDEAASPPSSPPPYWIDAAALLPSFDPRALARLAHESKDGQADDALVAMAPLVETEGSGLWVLKREARRDAIAHMVDQGTLRQALDLARRLDRDRRHGLYMDLLDQACDYGHIRVTVNDSQESLVAAQAIGDWFQRAKHQPVDLDRLSVLLEARDKIQPLRKLVGKHFQGREEELAILAEPAGFGPQHMHVLALTGLGGVGKSALIGRYVLTLIDVEVPKPVVYLDFDRAEVDPANPRKLIERIARNLGLLYAGLLGSPASRDFYQLEGIAAGDNIPPNEQLAHWLPKVDTEPELLRGLKQGLNDDEIVLVFDTFEVVCARGPEVLRRFADFVQLFLSILPRARIVISGRGRIDLPLDMYPMVLKDLDTRSARAVLVSHGVVDEGLQSRILEVMGSSPLVLRLAGQAVKSGKLSLNDINQFDAQARGTRVQGLLYTRVLGHISDPDIERLAHPGMVVRRITAEVIRVVLADVCRIAPAQAKPLFARLPGQIDLFEPASELRPDDDPLADPGALRHRQDLREALLQVMHDDPRWRSDLPLIHRRAADYYKDLPGLVARAERLYHLLMLDSEWDELEQDDLPWDDRMAPLLARSWAEPFPVRARAWLGLRLGLDWSEPGQDLRLVDWEIRTARVARERLRAGDAAGALVALHERQERTPGSVLDIVEANALTTLGRHADALHVLELALERRAHAPVAHVLQLQLMAADAADVLGRAADAQAHAESAAAMAGAAGDVNARLHALDVLGRVTGSPVVMRELERTFVDSPQRDLRADEQLAARVVRSFGSTSNAVLRKAASTFGDLPQQDLLTNDLRTWSSLFETVKSRQGGLKLLTTFAPRIGLATREDDPVRFATEVLRHGLRGETIDTLLTAFGDDPAIVAGSLATFKALP